MAPAISYHLICCKLFTVHFSSLFFLSWNLGKVFHFSTWPPRPATIQLVKSTFNESSITKSRSTEKTNEKNVNWSDLHNLENLTILIRCTMCLFLLVFSCSFFIFIFVFVRWPAAKPNSSEDESSLNSRRWSTTCTPHNMHNMHNITWVF